jgi:hypothetical protein
MKQFDLETALPAEALDYLRSVYRNPLECTHVRLKAAAIAIEYERPRLAVIASIVGDDFAERLGRALERSSLVRSPKVINAKPVAPVINHRLTPLVRRA